MTLQIDGDKNTALFRSIEKRTAISESLAVYGSQVNAIVHSTCCKYGRSAVGDFVFVANG